MATKTSTPTRPRATKASTKATTTARPKASAPRTAGASSAKAASTKAAAAATAAAEQATTAARRRIPKVELPKVDLPKVRVPKVELPKLELPKVELPKVRVPNVELPEQVTTAQQHVISTAKQVAARLNDQLDPAHRRSLVLSRVDQAQHQALSALEGLMTRTEKVRTRVDLPFVDDVREAIQHNAEFVVTLAKRQVEFAERVVKTLVPAA